MRISLPIVKPSGLEQPRNVRKRNRSFRGSKDLMKDEAQMYGREIHAFEVHGHEVHAMRYHP